MTHYYNRYYTGIITHKNEHEQPQPNELVQTTAAAAAPELIEYSYINKSSFFHKLNYEHIVRLDGFDLSLLVRYRKTVDFLNQMHALTSWSCLFSRNKQLKCYITKPNMTQHSEVKRMIQHLFTQTPSILKTFKFYKGIALHNLLCKECFSIILDQILSNCRYLRRLDFTIDLLNYETILQHLAKYTTITDLYLKIPMAYGYNYNHESQIIPSIEHLHMELHSFESFPVLMIRQQIFHFPNLRYLNIKLDFSSNQLGFYVRKNCWWLRYLSQFCQLLSETIAHSIEVIMLAIDQCFEHPNPELININELCAEYGFQKLYRL